MANPKKQKCESCHYYETVGAAGGGACCRYPPTINVIVNPVRQDIDWSNDQPYVNGTQWCGEWRAEGGESW